MRSILPFAGGGKVLRFSGRARSSSPRGTTEKRRYEDEDDLYRSLGRIAANWSLVEISSGVLLMGLVGSRDETLARAVVAGQRVENVWETIEALLSSHGSDTADALGAFRSWRRSANGFRRRRNEAIHCAWSTASANGGPAAWDVMSQKAKRGARSDLFPGGVEELEALARHIAVCEEQLNQIHSSVLVVMDELELKRSDGRHLESS